MTRSYVADCCKILVEKMLEGHCLEWKIREDKLFTQQTASRYLCEAINPITLFSNMVQYTVYRQKGRINSFIHNSITYAGKFIFSLYNFLKYYSRFIFDHNTSINFKNHISIIQSTTPCSKTSSKLKMTSM